ncbi:MAG: DNA polymerase III subunit [Chloroflexota bacterium]
MASHRARSPGPPAPEQHRFQSGLPRLSALWSRHTGKLTLAREFAKTLNCLEPDRPCGRCLSCRKIERGVHPDVQIVELEEGTKNISIEAIRAIQDAVALRPAEGRVKVYIVEEAEHLSEPAANSLLKTLEEPPPSVVMVLTTLDATLLLPTLVSRCQQIDLRPVPTEVIEATLRRTEVDPAHGQLVASLARGRVGWALKATTNPAMLNRRAELMDRLISLSTADRVTRFAYAAELATLHGRDPEAARSALESWQSWWRDLLLSRLGMEDLVVNADLKDRLRLQAHRYSIESLSRMVRAIQEGVALLTQNVNARLALEVLMLDVPRPQGR